MYLKSKRKYNNERAWNDATMRDHIPGVHLSHPGDESGAFAKRLASIKIKLFIHYNGIHSSKVIHNEKIDNFGDGTEDTG